MHWEMMARCFLLLLCSSALAGKPFLIGSEDLGDTAQTCNVDAVQVANLRQLHPILHDLVNTTFFRLFRVNLKNPICPYWKSADSEKEDTSSGGTCSGTVPVLSKKPAFAQKGLGAGLGFSSAAEPTSEPGCSVHSDGSNAEGGIDRKLTIQEKVAQLERDNETEPCEFEEDLPTYWVDMCSGDHMKGVDLEDVNLIKNPERNTGYNGSHIWQAMYNENCFEVGSAMPRGRFGTNEAMCYEERVLYRLLSGWHASTSISISKNFYAPGTKQKGAWSPNLERFMKDIGEHPERVKNLHFSFVVLLRAVKKAAPYLQSYSFHTGDEKEDGVTKLLMARLLDSQLLSLCSPLFEAFDETRLFHAPSEQRGALKRQFKSVFRNITELVDCVQCQRCRLHAKLFSLGLGTALKILLSPPDLIASTTSRDDVVALVNVLWKLSEAMEDVRSLTQQYYEVSSVAPSQPSPAPAAGQRVDAAIAVEADSSPMGIGTRRQLLDAALAASRRCSLSAEDEERLLDLLVAQGQVGEEILLLAKHYALDKADVFCRMAIKAAQAARPGSPSLVPAPIPQANLGEASNPADAVIVGGGLAGMAAAMSLLDRGGSVVMIEKQPYLGGNSGKASSGINAALETSVESLVADTTKSAGKLARPDLIERLAQESSEAVQWLRDRTKVDLSMRSQLGGHTAKRTLRPSNAFVGAELTFAAGQVLTKMATERNGRFRLLLKSKWVGLKRQDQSGGWVAEVEANGTKVEVHGAAMVVASGGFGHDSKEVESLLLKHRPDLADFPTTLGAQTTGDGVKIARDIGARLVDMDRVQLHPTGFVDVNKPIETTKTLAAELLRGVGGLLLDRNGRRFTDELGTRQAVVNAELKASEEERALPQPSPPRAFAIVLNGKAAAMADRHTTLYSKKGLLMKVDGIAGVAERFGYQVDVVNATFTAYNEAAKKGKDEFGRTVFPAGHFPIEADESFYVGEVVPVIHYTMGGIAINPEGQVLDQKGDPIPKLYAIGEASGGVHGDNRLAGNSLLECTVFGRHVGQSLPIRPRSDVPRDQPAPPPAPETTSEELRQISVEELAQHRAEGDVWVSLYGKIYDLTEYVWEHPGGSQAIFDVGGQDGTETFEAVHNKELLESMGFTPVGVLA